MDYISVDGKWALQNNQVADGLSDPIPITLCGKTFRTLHRLNQAGAFEWARQMPRDMDALFPGWREGAPVLIYSDKKGRWIRPRTSRRSASCAEPALGRERL